MLSLSDLWLKHSLAMRTLLLAKSRYRELRKNEGGNSLVSANVATHHQTQCNPMGREKIFKTPEQWWVESLNPKTMNLNSFKSDPEIYNNLRILAFLLDPILLRVSHLAILDSQVMRFLPPPKFFVFWSMNEYDFSRKDFGKLSELPPKKTSVETGQRFSKLGGFLSGENEELLSSCCALSSSALPLSSSLSLLPPTLWRWIDGGREGGWNAIKRGKRSDRESTDR